MPTEDEKMDVIARLGTKEGLQRCTQKVIDTWKQIKTQNGLPSNASYSRQEVHHTKVQYYKDKDMLATFLWTTPIKYYSKAKELRHETIRKLAIDLYYYEIYTEPMQREEFERRRQEHQIAYERSRGISGMSYEDARRKMEDDERRGQ